MLKIRSLKSYYESICALKAVSLHVGRGEIVTLIGANGSGKSTLLNTITGLLGRVEGSILFEDREIVGMSSSFRSPIFSNVTILFFPLRFASNRAISAFSIKTFFFGAASE